MEPEAFRRAWDRIVLPPRPSRRLRRIFPHETALIEIDREGLLADLGERVRTQQYVFDRERHEVVEPRGPMTEGRKRTHALLSLHDELVLTAVTDAAVREAGWLAGHGLGCWSERAAPAGIDPGDWEQDFSVMGENRTQALRAMRAGVPWLLVLDIANFYPSLPAAAVDARLAEAGATQDTRTRIGWAIDGVRPAIGGGSVSRTTGVPTGIPASNVLAVSTLAGLDALLRAKSRHQSRFIDDSFVLCDTRAQAESLLSEAQAWTAANGLALNMKKSFVRSAMEMAKSHRFGTRTPLHKKTTGRQERLQELRMLVHPMQRFAVRAGFRVGANSSLLRSRVVAYLSQRLSRKHTETENILGYLKEIGLHDVRAAVGADIATRSTPAERRWFLGMAAAHDGPLEPSPALVRSLERVLEDPSTPLVGRASARAVLGRCAANGREELIARGFDRERQSLEDADQLVSLAKCNKAFVDDLVRDVRPNNRAFDHAVRLMRQRQ